MINPSNLEMRRRRRKGFTFVEVLVASVVLVLFIGVSLAAMTQFNRYAQASRLKSHALAVAQQKLDEILTAQWRVASGGRPPVLAVSTRTENNLSLNSDSFNSDAALKSEFTSLAIPQTCTRVTTIADVSTRVLRATVTVTFTYAGKSYSVALSTLRATDTI